MRAALIGVNFLLGVSNLALFAVEGFWGNAVVGLFGLAVAAVVLAVYPR